MGSDGVMGGTESTVLHATGKEGGMGSMMTEDAGREGERSDRTHKHEPLVSYAARRSSAPVTGVALQDGTAGHSRILGHAMAGGPV